MSRSNIIRERWAFLTGVWGPAGAPLFCAAVVTAHLIAAWFNAGFLNADEHYQIIEFAQYKLGWQSAGALAWEFAERMRPALQPLLAATAIRFHHAAGIASPFTIAFTLRLLSTILGAIAAFELCVRCLRPVSDVVLRRAALFLAFLLWIAPTSHGRFSSENWGGMWLAVGVCAALDAADAWPLERRRSILFATCAGIAWSLSFFFRFQVAASVAGAVVWLLLVRRAPRAVISAIAVSFVATCAANIILDHWLYGIWTLTPLNYARVNLIEGRSAAFGVGPWWLILVYMLVALVPPFSLAIVALLVAGSWYARRDVVVWTVIPFLVVHMIVPHKEPRFIMPLLYFIGPWFAVCASSMPSEFWQMLLRRRTSLTVAAALFCTVDLAVLCVTAVLPANDRIALDRWLWEQKARGIDTVYALAPRQTALPSNLTNSFYESGVRFEPFVAISTPQLDHKETFVYYSGSRLPIELSTIKCTPMFRTFPAWLGESQLFHRMAGVETDSVCRMER